MYVGVVYMLFLVVKLHVYSFHISISLMVNFSKVTVFCNAAELLSVKCNTQTNELLEIYIM